MRAARRGCCRGVHHLLDPCVAGNLECSVLRQTSDVTRLINRPWSSSSRVPHARGAGVSTQARHLLERGYDRLVYAEPAEVGFVARVDGRHAGASEVVGSPLPRVRITDDDTLDPLVRDWAAGPGRTGVCAFDDRTALEVLAALHRADVDVPGRVGVVGVDDSSAAPFAFPSLSSVRLDLDTQARDLARRTVQTIDGEPWQGLLLRDDGAWVVARSST
ncbi:substrate-binding domain-containing protein [Cellulomonas persica]|uniref:substrate-binding domain-containing protein n=1 Tax=Cellulomonas persica TaxID=76861 RepID=UPI001649BDCA|nr:substrate-binding domain-containing protein [Cellulomonas persica]